ncbi:MAG: protease modulator HflC [Lentisphaeria bacterium]|nr:protease modulator HflC [Lentisphaeria bacterium]
MSVKTFFKHWPTILLGVVVTIVLLLAIVTYQVPQTEHAVLTTLGRIEPVSPEPGLHFKWPYPFQKVHYFDARTRCFDGNAGKLEETSTADGQNILIGTYVNYRIDDAKIFFKRLERIGEAEKQLNSWMRDARNAVIGRYAFNQLINTAPEKMMLRQIVAEIKERLAQTAAPFGLKIESVGINAINVPPAIGEEIFKRMIQDRKVVVQRFLSEGSAEASRIRTEADRQSAEILTDAEARAKTIRAEGDAEAAQHYEVFQQNPELAAFLRKLDSLRSIVRSRTTLILDTDAAPFDLLKPGAVNLK